MPVDGSCGAEELSNDLLTALLAGKEFSFTPPDLSGPDYSVPSTFPGSDIEIDPITAEALTNRQVNGTGVFDALMESINNHLKGQFEKNRITGDQYAKAYIELTSAALTTAVQFLVQKDQAFWQAITAKLNAEVAQASVTKAKVELEIAKAQLRTIVFEAYTAEANYGLTKIKLSSESVGFCTAKYNLDNILPFQRDMLKEQIEERRAQTLNTRTDGAPVEGVIGKQRDLYSQQITSYQRDAETKVAKIFSDAWITMKTLDEGLLPPTGFTNASLDDILEGLKTNVGFVTP